METRIINNDAVCRHQWQETGRYRAWSSTNANEDADVPEIVCEKCFLCGQERSYMIKGFEIDNSQDN